MGTECMVPFEEAFECMMGAAVPLAHESVGLSEACGRILAEDIQSDIDMPPFDKSAMDGYACRRKDLTAGSLQVIEEIPAGAWPTQSV
ncbi:MAG: gephyrin-like molybdotransferase Glp, partial [Planctomycetota bacterium]